LQKQWDPTPHPIRMTAHAPMLASFWIAGFDGTDHVPGGLAAKGLHDIDAYRRRVEADYDGVRDAGVECVRESVGWRSGASDFQSAIVRAQCARRAGLQVVWTLCHAGWPADVDVASPAFVERFRDFAGAAARALAPYAGGRAPVFTPVNEISFLSWALAETSLFGVQRSDLRHRGYEIKQQLVRAALAGCDAILEVHPGARFLHRDATMIVGAPADAHRRDAQFETCDMLVGRLEPQLGGHARYVDAIDVHCHHTGAGRGASPAPSSSSAGLPAGSLPRLLEDVHARYGCPVVVSETNRTGSGRAAWLREFGEEIGEALARGVPLIGASLCRVVERAAWEDPRCWRGRRLWDVLLDGGDDLPRVANSAYEHALRDVKARVAPLLAHSHRR